jgi:hypothetical protein
MPSESPLRLAVVGHTNTGKTSLLRTLTRDADFGEVDDSPGTTRHVEGAHLLLDGAVAVELYDTPGMEDGIALLDYLDQLAPPAERVDGPERIRRFLQSPESTRRFEQEARVLRKLLDCDAGLYVVDVRDPVLGKHKDELAILASCGHPLLPVLNFTHSPEQRLATWRETLARLGLHAMVEFDTIAPALDGESQLYDKLALLMDRHAELLRTLKDDVAQQRQIRHNDALRLIAELLVDVAACRLVSPPDDASLQSTTQTLRQQVRGREQACVQSLLARYNFDSRHFSSHRLPLQGERWGMDLFHPQALKDVGIRVTKGMAAGAMAGATMDVFMAGISLGTATLVGAAAGGLWQGAERLGKRIVGRLRGYQELTVDDGVLRLLALRQLALVDALEQRGHAARKPLELDEILLDTPAGRKSSEPDDTPRSRRAAGPSDALREAWRSKPLPEELAEARSRPEWSILSADYTAGPRRDELVRALARQLSAPVRAGQVR